MFDQTSQTACVQQVPQNTATTLAIGDIIRWPLAGYSDAIALIVDVESIAGWRVLTIAPGVDDHAQPVQSGTLRVTRLDEVRQSGLLQPLRFDLERGFCVAPSHPALQWMPEMVVVGHLCDTALERLHDQRAHLHALRDIAAAKRKSRRAARRGDRRTGWRVMPRPARPNVAQEGRQ